MMNCTKTLELRRIDSLIPYANNARTHSADQIELLRRNLREFGFVAPIIIDADGNIIAGHGRVMAAAAEGMETVPCVIADGLSEEQRKAYILADNRLCELGGWDSDLLNKELEALDLSGFDVSLTGFALPDTFDEAEIVEDDPPEVSEDPPVAKLGDIYQLGQHRLMCGDSTSSDDVQMLTGGAQMDMLLTDPPYNVNYKGAAGKIMHDNLADDKFRTFLASAFRCAAEVMKPGAAFHIWHSDVGGYSFRAACIDAGLRVRQCLVWVKDSFTLGRQDFQWQHEACLYGEKEADAVSEENDGYGGTCLYGWVDGKHYWFKNRKQTTLLYFDRPKRSESHPTMKPVRMFGYEIQCNTKPGWSVLDLFGGSGTTLIACEQSGRKCYMMELDPRYVDVIVKRWEALTGQKAELVGGDTCGDT